MAVPKDQIRRLREAAEQQDEQRKDALSRRVFTSTKNSRKTADDPKETLKKAMASNPQTVENYEEALDNPLQNDMIYEISIGEMDRNKFKYLDFIEQDLTDFECGLMEKIRRISYSSDEEQQLLSVLDRTINSIAKSRLPRIDRAPILWADRNKGEKAHEFIMRVYGEYVDAGALLRSDLRRLDQPLNVALLRQEQNKDPEKRPPEGFYIPRQQDDLAEDPSAVVKGGTHEGRQSNPRKRQP